MEHGFWCASSQRRPVQPELRFRALGPHVGPERLRLQQLLQRRANRRAVATRVANPVVLRPKLRAVRRIRVAAVPRIRVVAVPLNRPADVLPLATRAVRRSAAAEQVPWRSARVVCMTTCSVAATRSVAATAATPATAVVLLNRLAVVRLLAIRVVRLRLPAAVRLLNRLAAVRLLANRLAVAPRLATAAARRAAARSTTAVCSASSIATRSAASLRAATAAALCQRLCRSWLCDWLCQRLRRCPGAATSPLRLTTLPRCPRLRLPIPRLRSPASVVWLPPAARSSVATKHERLIA